MKTNVEITSMRLYRKSPGSAHLRKSAAAELRHLLAVGWHETERVEGADHVLVRFERPLRADPMVRPHKGDSSPFKRQ
jgi:hypothetical protein